MDANGIGMRFAQLEGFLRRRRKTIYRTLFGIDILLAGVFLFQFFGILFFGLDARHTFFNTNEQAEDSAVMWLSIVPGAILLVVVLRCASGTKGQRLTALMVYGFAAVLMLGLLMALNTFVFTESPIGLHWFSRMDWKARILWAPLLEEPVKIAGIVWAPFLLRRFLPQIEMPPSSVTNYALFGVAMAAVFGSLENYSYASETLQLKGLSAAALHALVRFISVTSHAASSCIAAAAIGFFLLARRTPWLPALGMLAAMQFHALYNWFAGIGSPWVLLVVALEVTVAFLVVALVGFAAVDLLPRSHAPPQGPRGQNTVETGPGVDTGQPRG